MSNQQHILLVGATGFTGKQVLQEIAEHNKVAHLANKPTIKVTAFCRKGSTPVQPDSSSPLLITRGDLNDEKSLEAALFGKDGLIYVASLGFGHSKSVVAACEKCNIKRAVFVSTTAIFTKLNAPSKKIRMEAEADIISASFPWTIIRPTMIFGKKGDRNMERLVQYIKKFPVLFVPGSDKAKQQPVFVNDVAKAVVNSYLSSKAERKSYNISGKEELTFKEVVTTTAGLLHKKIIIINLPLKPICWLVSIYEKFAKKPKIKVEQLLRLNEDKVFNHAPATVDFGYYPQSFKDSMKTLIDELENS